MRGGNFDENLVYVNDIEIHRPFLVRSSQQEGMSFVNPDMVSSIKFSAGGFDATYGDKMSSVLDIVYRKPNEFGGSASISLLGGSRSPGRGFKEQTFHTYFRISLPDHSVPAVHLETKGEYNPNFLDFQTLLTYKLAPKWEISFLGNIAKNRFHFIPETRKHRFRNL